MKHAALTHTLPSLAACSSQSLSSSFSSSASIPQRFLCLCHRAKLPNSFRFRWPYVLLPERGWRGRVQGLRVGFNDLRRRPRFNNIFCCFFFCLCLWLCGSNWSAFYCPQLVAFSGLVSHNNPIQRPLFIPPFSSQPHSTLIHNAPLILDYFLVPCLPFWLGQLPIALAPVTPLPHTPLSLLLVAKWRLRPHWRGVPSWQPSRAVRVVTWNAFDVTITRLTMHDVAAAHFQC